MTDLGTLGGALSSAAGINDLGVIVGQADNDEGLTRAFVHANGTMTDLGTLGGLVSAAFGINNAGQIFGVSEFESNSIAVHAFLFENGAMIDLGTLGGLESFPHAMNSQGHIVGRRTATLRQTFRFCIATERWSM